MKRSDFHYTLPEQLIAHHPPERRGDSRLLELAGGDGRRTHRQFAELPGLLAPGDLLVFNDTRVLPARLRGRKATGGRVEVLVERSLDAHRALAHVRASRAPAPGSALWLGAEDEPDRALVESRQDGLFVLCFDRPLRPLLERHGRLPLPPYIRREQSALDRERYQTVFGRREGAVAAPTAGLHFSRAMLTTLEERGVELGFVTLHVGAGTFQPVRSEDLRDHVMHREWLEVGPTLCEQVAATRRRGGRVIAVGTTAVRSLETAAATGRLQPYRGETDCFIYPGHRFQVIDGLITNFHLPESTLLMLVSALAGREAVLAAYDEAVAEGYRFFSYGDAMLIWPRPGVRASSP